MAGPVTAFGDNAVLNLLKRRYGKVSQLIPLKSELWKEMQSAPSFKFNGRDFLFPVVKAPGGGFVNYSDGGKFPAAVAPNIADATVPIRLASTLVSFSNLQMDLGKTDEAGFLGNTDLMVKMAIENFIRKLNLNIYGRQPTTVPGGGAPVGKSVNGVVNRVDSVAGGPPVTSMVVNRPLGYLDADLGSTRATKYLDVGDVLSYGTIAGATYTVKGHFQVTAIARSTNTLSITLLSSGGGQPAADDFLCFCDADSATNNSYGKAPQGLGTLVYQTTVDDVAQTIQGVAVDTNNARGWSTSIVTSAGPFDQADWHQAKRTVDIVSNGDVTLMVNDPTMIDIYAQTLFPDQRLGPQEAKGGMKQYPAFASGKGDIKQLYDDHCPYGMTFFLTKGEIFNLKNREPSWQTAGGGQWKAIQGMDSVYAAFCAYYNHGFQTLNTHAVVKGITVPNAPI